MIEKKYWYVVLCKNATDRPDWIARYYFDNLADAKESAKQFDDARVLRAGREACL